MLKALVIKSNHRDYGSIHERALALLYYLYMAAALYWCIMGSGAAGVPWHIDNYRMVLNAPTR